jgi:hypothetical protein
MLRGTIICLLLIGLSFEAPHRGQEVRDFIEGLMKAVKGKDYKLDDGCLAVEFSNDFESFLDAIEKENVMLSGALAGKIWTDYNEKCPSNDLKKLSSDSDAFINDKDMMNKLVKHSTDIVHILKEAKDTEPKDPKIMGGHLGKLLNLVLYDTPKENVVLNFLQEIEPSQLTEESIELFVNGFFEGVSSVPIEQNKCSVDITSVKSEIILAFSDIISAIKSKKDIVKAILEFYSLSLKLGGLDSNCHFSQLSSDIAALGTKIGISKLVMRLSLHLVSFLEYAKGTYSNLESKEYKESGKNFGELTKLALNYSTI